ncbi:hypothetical protein [Halopiger djelfimassiliensis]|uniref:hypothetical protein n=1 Tax=Halopiger djelfimassiliensis TaxID=1293047 RepID=UPI00067789A7|nr:hypothetical protein [Halopiger djelfimassiliensis]
MTSRDWRADRRAVFERDASTCRLCDAAADDFESLRTYPVGDVPLEGTVHESALVTLCEGCFSTLRTPTDATEPTPPTSDGLFRVVHETTRIQGEAISDVASFASLSTSFPDDEGERPDDSTEYVEHRQDLLLATDAVEARLERLAAVEESALDPDVRPLLSAFRETAAELQSHVRTLVELGERVVAGVDCCHCCFEPFETEDASEGACSACALPHHSTDEWRRDDGAVAFDVLFSAINETLQDASATTEELTDRTTKLAHQLTE